MDAKEYQRQIQEYRRTLYAGYPEVERFEKIKRWIALFFLAYCLILFFAKINVAHLPGALAFRQFVTGTGVNLIFIFAALGPNWRVACGLYFLVFWNLVIYIQNFRYAGITSWEAFRWAYLEGFSEYPLHICLDYLTWLLTLLLLILAIWLTLVPANRRMAVKSGELNEQMKAYMASHPFQK